MKCSKAANVFVLEMLDFSLLQCGSFDLVLVLSCLVMLAYFIPFAFSSVRAETLGMESDKAAFLISVLGKLTNCRQRLISVLNVPQIIST